MEGSPFLSPDVANRACPQRGTNGTREADGLLWSPQIDG